MRTAFWLYVFMFVAIFDLHAQYPILSPFALSIGAAPSFIGLIMGMYSLTHLPGNMIAGFSVDRYGSRVFIATSLIGAGIILLFQSQVTNPWELLIIRSISGFVLAFLSPACLALLARLAKDHIQQGKFMAGNGLVHTLASVVSPAAGAYLVAKVGFAMAFIALGWILIVTGAIALFAIREPNATLTKQQQRSATSASNTVNDKTLPVPWLFFLVPLAVSCSQGILFFELPLMDTSSEGIISTGILFSAVSLGALITLSLLFLNRFSPFIRTMIGNSVLAVTFFGIAVHWPVPLIAALLLIGMAKGLIFPAMTSLLLQLSGGVRYGRTFSILSISLSVGAFLGPLMAGQYRDYISPYYLAFLGLMIALLWIPNRRDHATPTIDSKAPTA